jgi:glutathione S-transferase
MVSEYWLRWRTGIYSGKITVPVLFVHDHDKNEDVILTDSFDIAKYSDNNKLNDSSRIVPDDQVEEIKKWNEIADSALNAARSDAVIEMGKDEEAKTEQVPGFLKTIGLGSFVGGQGVNYFLSKYPSDIEQNRRIIRENLIKVREQLKNADYLVNNTFSYADITVAAILQMVLPIDDNVVPLTTGFRRCCTVAHTDIAEEFKDVIEWRNNLVAKHFPSEIYKNQHKCKL